MIALRILKAVWFVTMLAVMATLLYAYASLPGEVVVGEDGTEMMSLSRNNFFYAMVGLLAFVNVIVFVAGAVMSNASEFRTWVYGLVASFNFFFIIGISFISLYNSQESYDYSRLENVIYASMGLFGIWTLGWPLYLGYRRFFNDQKVL